MNSSTQLPNPDDPEFAAMLEKMRNIGLRMDFKGRLWHQGAEVEHARLRHALLHWIAVRDGRYIIEMDAKRYAYIDVEDVPLRVSSLWLQNEKPWVLTDDGVEEELDVSELALADDDNVYVRVRNKKLWARFTSAAHQALFEHVESDETGNPVAVFGGAKTPFRLHPNLKPS